MIRQIIVDCLPLHHVLTIVFNFLCKKMKLSYHVKSIWNLISSILSGLGIIALTLGGLLTFFVENYIGAKLIFCSIISFTLSITYDIVYYKEWSMIRRIINLILFCGGLFIIIVVCWILN